MITRCERGLPTRRDLDTIVRRITEHGGSVTEGDVRAVLLETVKVCESLLLEGFRVNPGDLCDLFPRITGVFHGATDHFDPARHRVEVGANPGHRLRNTVRDNAHVMKEGIATRPVPIPQEYLDLGSGETNGALTPGGIGTLNGARLKFDPAQSDEGIFLITEDSARPEAQANRISVCSIHL
uniref:Bvu-2165-like IHF-HU-like DNA-binding domain-containing protein n=1 Tax=Candidatus Kentrum sp. MB TaxID=2138164 RepID=A0A450XSZ5_9GAMM|nr:MAG: protein of unknown function (DUF4469) with IG-like fold [Candidatus Kentron sp. MB]VFK35308.1 MAG: protein of unknown function (DUF4469) with IG-like fold [Candidatus Kentron sp. MB]VFK77232.1 MAG: protein of unknown function (DUF4469) with IG-like fold [Candidatus Kentron sp. MB]